MTAVVIAFLSFSGCAELEKKFIRKKTPKPVRPIFNVEPEPRPYPELYREHFRFWKTWHDEILKDLQGNPKRLHRDLEEARRHLVYLEKYLQREKRKIVHSFVVELDGLRDRIARERASLSQGGLGTTERQLESLGLRISNSLAYKKMKEFLLPTPLPFNLSDYQAEEPEILPLPVKPSPPPAER